MNSQRRLSFAFKVATTVCCLIGIMSNLVRTTSIASILSFYTMQSNIFVLLFYTLYIVIRIVNPNVDKSKTYHTLKGATVMIIFLTFVVYNISLHSMGFMMDVKTSSSNILRFSNLFVHFITPIMVFLDYLIFDEKGYFKTKNIFVWFIFPALYPVYVYTYARFGGTFFSVGGSKKYAYFFLDIDKLGIDGVLGYLLLFSIFYLFACYLLVRIDRFLGKRKKKTVGIH